MYSNARHFVFRFVFFFALSSLIRTFFLHRFASTFIVIYHIYSIEHCDSIGEAAAVFLYWKPKTEANLKKKTGTCNSNACNQKFNNQINHILCFKQMVKQIKKKIKNWQLNFVKANGDRPSILNRMFCIFLL